jgi:hypothetical protein
VRVALRRRNLAARMSTDFTMSVQADYLRVELARGYEIQPQGTSDLTRAVSDACARQGLRRVLIEGEVARRKMDTMDSFSLGSLMGSLLSGMAVACCLTGFTPDRQTRFFKDVAQNRGVRVEFFDNREAALRWLGAETQL